MTNLRRTPCWKFGDAQLDERTLELRVKDVPIDLERKPLEVLRYLLAHAGEMVAHDQLLDAVWPRRIVTENVLKQSVSRLREVLGDDSHEIIKTVRGYGYRLLLPVALEQPEAAVLVAPEFEPAGGSGPLPCTVLSMEIGQRPGAAPALGEAAASRQQSHLLSSIAAETQAWGGKFIKSYWRELLAVFEDATDAANAAAAAQRKVDRFGLGLYAGLYRGEVEFRREPAGPLEATGPAIAAAVRLHKLTEGVPGRIFLSGETVQALSPALRELAARYGNRELRGLGAEEVWTLEWQQEPAAPRTSAGSRLLAAPAAGGGLLLQYRGATARFEPRAAPCLVGRGKACHLHIPDAEAKVSSSHLMFEHGHGHWLVQDVSRNGSWMRDDSGRESRLPQCVRVMLPAAGCISLGRPFADDPAGGFRIGFSTPRD